MNKNTQTGDRPGNARASALAFQQHLIKIGEKMLALEKLLDTRWDDLIQVEALRFRAPTPEYPGWLVVVKATIEAGPSVAFHSADTFAEAFVGVYNRLQNNTLQWKDDKYVNTNQGET